ncbi:hypothetical protein C8A01DRAFT_41676 [Parachaetomium inaequale]|uniref:Uncharacterized protein n=1 Tax=Parachaetomium inaequale TaxID=2588326 RepID=A0AAN6P522_9PEZI|nr:hypothetical protein C8A01DRAFT_41676 [Parachaetomium inaequale]
MSAVSPNQEEPGATSVAGQEIFRRLAELEATVRRLARTGTPTRGVMDGLLDEGGLYAIALDIFSPSHLLEAWGTVLVDGRCLRHIHKNQMGAGPSNAAVRSTFASLYGHPGRAE